MHVAPISAAPSMASASSAPGSLAQGIHHGLPAPQGIAANLRRGRGANLNPSPRFERFSSEIFDDGWESLGELAELPPLQTILTRDSSKTVISWNQSPDLGFDRAVNPYRGCEHGCVYCYARPSHAYLGFSPGLDFETRLVFKPDVASLLERELRKPGYQVQTMALGSNTDPYQPIERQLKLTRSVLEVSIVTKSDGVLRDLDILQRMAARNLVRVWVSVTTLDPVLTRRMEPRASATARRLKAISVLNAAGVPACVLAAPMIPGLNDAELEGILERARRAGAPSAGYILLRLPHELREIFDSWLHENYPERAKHVLSLIRDTRGGVLNDSRFHDRFSGQGAYAEMLSKRFARANRTMGFVEPEALNTKYFTAPAGDETAKLAQLSLF